MSPGVGGFRLLFGFRICTKREVSESLIILRVYVRSDEDVIVFITRLHYNENNAIVSVRQ